MTEMWGSKKRGSWHCVAALLVFLFASAESLQAQPGPQPGVLPDQVVLGHSGDLSGPLADLGSGILKGAKLYFDGVNASGGVHGRKIKLIVKDDSYDVKRSVDNINAYLANEEVFALFGTFGTPNNEALIPLAQKAGLPVVAPYTGAMSVRGHDLRGVFNIRASYAEETEKLVEHLVTLNLRKLAIIHQDNAFGREVLTAALAALQKRGLKPVVVASVQNDATDAAAASTKVVTASPEAVLLGLAGKPTIETIRNLRQRQRGLALYAPSVLAAPANLRALGNDATGIAVTQIVPFPLNNMVPVVREYQNAATAAGEKEFTHLGLEGFINAKVAVEGLRRAGRNLTRAGYAAALDNLRKYDVGGMEISFGQGAASGARLVDLTMINAQGKLIH
jgi:branched-chain amino acid transport system substrate-binding protein